ncbi:MAG TPA: MBL fold metallo-hydrolase [Sphingomicrobium sp.]|jgi:glyoxylase-like metal-dependent hydrolase (beta-lactamase superfamily II)|nr:MBL fold metallo-hydrolase [Sphingomicrobium sp.]
MEAGEQVAQELRPAVSPDIRAFFDEATNSVSYLVADSATRAAAAIDPVLGFDPVSGRIDHEGADRILSAAEEGGYSIAWILETHAHADHLSAAQYLKRRTGAKLAIGAGIREVQGAFAPRFGADDVKPDGGDFDRLLDDGEALALGDLTIEVIATPGHTPACVSYKVGDAVFVGDTMFMPDYGTARCDFPGGDARQLYRSMQRILSLPRETRLFMCHDYKAPGRDAFAWETTVGEQRDRNVHIAGGVGEDDYVAMRTARDATLKVPKLLYPAIQVNIRGGRLPPADANGMRYLKLPLSLPDAD